MLLTRWVKVCRVRTYSRNFRLLKVITYLLTWGIFTKGFFPISRMNRDELVKVFFLHNCKLTIYFNLKQTSKWVNRSERPYVGVSRTTRESITFSIALGQGGGLPKWSATVTYRTDRIAHATHTLRWPGSSLKPFDYKESASPTELTGHCLSALLTVISQNHNMECWYARIRIKGNRNQLTFTIDRE